MTVPNTIPTIAPVESPSEEESQKESIVLNKQAWRLLSVEVIPLASSYVTILYNACSMHCSALLELAVQSVAEQVNVASEPEAAEVVTLMTLLMPEVWQVPAVAPVVLVPEVQALSV